MKISKEKFLKLFILQGKPNKLLCFLISLSLIMIIFPDVVFNKGTLSMLDMANITWKNRTYGFYHPERPMMAVHYGYSDTGGAAFQSETMIQFMKYSIWSKQSPYWNPYSATGAVGPETLIDNKFSPLTLLVAILGGSNTAFHFVLLSLYVLAIYFIIRIVTSQFNLSLLAGMTAGIVYLLNGYSVANISSNVAQSYLYFPFLLFALCSLILKPNYWRFSVAIFANILLLLTTFLPTTTLVLLSVYLISFGFAINHYSSRRSRFSAIGMQVLSGVVAFFALAFLWLPILEAAGTLKLFEMYGARFFYTANKGAFLLFFSPKHFWEAYNATPDKVWNYINNVIFHFGIIATIIVAQVLSKKENFKNWVIIICLGLFILFLGRIFSVPVIFQIFGAIPLLKNIGGQYLWIVIAISFTILSGFGMDSLTKKGNKLPLFFIYIVLSISILYLWLTFLPQASEYINFTTSPAYKVFIDFNLGVIGILALLSAIIFFHIKICPNKILLWKISLLILAFLELFYYMNTMRYKREDIFKNPPSYVQFIKDNISDKRLVTYSWNFNPELGAAYQIPQVESQNYVFPWYQKFYERNFQTPHDRWTVFTMVFGQKDEPNIHEEILDMLSVKYIITDKTMPKYRDYFLSRNYPIVYQDDLRYIFENIDPLPRANIMPVLVSARLTPDTQGHNISQVVFSEDQEFINQAKDFNISSNPENQDSIGEAKITKYENTKIVIKANLQKPGILAMMDNYHPGWKAYANGKEVYIGKINESFRGIALPAGDYTIEMKYEPKSLKLGLWFTGITAFILLILLVFRRRFDKFFTFLVKSKLIIKPPQKLNENVSFAVVLPMYNEEINVKNCIDKIDNFLKKLKQKTAIIAVNDGSSDQTLAELKKAQKKTSQLIIESHKKNLGYGAANVTGANVAFKKHFDYVLFMDADLTQEPKYISGFVTEMKKGTDYIKATRYSLGGKVKDVPLKRRIISQFGNYLAKMLFRLPLSDYTNGFRAAKTNILSQVECYDRGFSYLIEEVRQISKLAKTYAEVPYVLTVRTDSSKSKFRYNPKVYYNYLKHLFRR